MPGVPERLQKIRDRKDLKLRPTKYLKQTFTGFDRKEHPLKIRYYQVQGILHLVAMKRFLLGDDTGLGKCVVGDTLVWTDRGLLPIAALAPKPLDQLVPGEFYDIAEPTRVWTGSKWAAVRRFYYDGMRPTKKVTTRNGLSVEGSHKHPLKVRTGLGEGWRRLPDLKEGDHLLVDRQRPAWPEDPEILFSKTFSSNAKLYRVPDRLTGALARLLGYVVAEGHSPDKYHLSVTQHDSEAHADIRRLFKEVFGWEGNFDNKRKGLSIDVASVQIRSFLETCGIGPALSAGKRVPPLIMRGSRGSAVEFLRGFFEGEGHALEGSGVEVSSASEQLLREVQLLLLRLGLVSVLKPKKVKGRYHTYWRLTLFGDDARGFAEQVGFITHRKRQALLSVLEKGSNPNHDVVPHARSMVEALRAEIYVRCGRHGYKGGGISKRWGTAFYNTLGHVRAERRNPTYGFLHQMLRVAQEVGVPDNHPAVAEIRKVCSQRSFYDPIVSIEDGFAEVMDIEVDDPAHCFVANGLVNHNTLQSIAALCFVWEKAPDTKAIVLTTKSATPQWAGEFEKFTQGVNVIVCAGTAKKRAKARKAFEESTGPTVMVYGYGSVRRDISDIQAWEGYVLITDEATAYKNPKTQIHQVVRHMSFQAERVWALTATLIKNHLMEGYGIFKVVKPDLFQMNATKFMFSYCLTQMVSIPKSNRKIPKIIGYLPERIAEFREEIAPFFLGRPKHEVASDLPALVMKKVEVGLNAAQQEKYDEALTGILEMGRGEDAILQETTKLTQIIYCQEIVNHLDLIDCDGGSDKLNALLDLLTDGDLADEKVIVFSRFSKMIDLMMPALKKAKIKAVRITGAEKMPERKKAMDAFQDPNSDTRVVGITMAAGDAINLQAAKAIVFFDTPWSAGDFIQIVGRMIRIGSVHDRCYAIHLVARGKKPTIDSRVIDVMNNKMKLVEAVIGRRLKGEQDIGSYIPVENDISDLFNLLREDARNAAG